LIAFASEGSFLDNSTFGRILDEEEAEPPGTLLAEVDRCGSDDGKACTGDPRLLDFGVCTLLFGKVGMDVEVDLCLGDIKEAF
jgi:hypothetical protein